jgi:carbon-monoxide dehydrogenase medium subunit
MYPSPFDYTAPTTLNDALTALTSTVGAKILAGGQSLLPLLKQRLIAPPPLLVDIAHVADLAGVHETDGDVIVKTLLTHAESAKHPTLGRAVPLLATASSWVADRQVRQRGTVCGALVNADPASDECCAVLALGGAVIARSPQGTRDIPAEVFFIDGHRSALQPNEILVELRVPKRRPGEGWGYEKLGVRGGHSGWAITGVAAWISMCSGHVTAARIAISGAGRMTTLAHTAAHTLIGTDGSDTAIAEAVEQTSKDIDLVADMNGSIAYKAQLIHVYARHALTEAITRAKKETC